MTLHWYSSQVFSLGNCVDDTPLKLASHLPDDAFTVNDGRCTFCGLLEDVPHLFLGCFRVQAFWSSFGITSSFTQVEQLWNADLPGPGRTSARMRLMLCRNAKVFDLVDEPNVVTLRRCSLDLLLWRSRASSPVDSLCLELWSSFILCNL